LDVSAGVTGPGSVIVSWTPILYTADSGYYEVGDSATQGGPYTFLTQNRTADKLASGITIAGLPSGTQYLVVRTVTLAHWYNQSTLTGLPSAEVAVTMGVGKMGPDGSAIGAFGAIVTAVFPDFFYIESQDRSCGIRVVTSGQSPAPGMVDVMGVLRTNQAGERYIEASSVATGGPGVVEPLALTNKALGGDDWRYDPITGAGQRGVKDGRGLNNIGLLVRIWGQVTLSGRGWFYIDDGSGVSDGSGVLGIYVDAGGTPAPAKGAIVAVTGISSCDSYLGSTVNTLLAMDVSVIRPATAAVGSVAPDMDAASPRTRGK
jgi:hypothetical protein